ncbi:hypothetical protein Tdes44962_MAKER05642 [Teratosphaeria destructans]|uniref:DUF7730 domain-containing protein n=1 Tax=Teratosphaeria destructans TaxID=418781 RepID=A0A9W7VYD0_9PEZI|nr:hypothetical protein Tdes44962_MAKER05642 [Teratosphaeria destructans]
MSASTPSEPCLFLSLPLEVRCLVYEHLFTTTIAQNAKLVLYFVDNEEDIFQDDQGQIEQAGLLDWFRPDRKQFKLKSDRRIRKAQRARTQNTAILQTCQIISFEAQDVLYSCSKFSIELDWRSPMPSEYKIMALTPATGNLISRTRKVESLSILTSAGTQENLREALTHLVGLMGAHYSPRQPLDIKAIEIRMRDKDVDMAVVEGLGDLNCRAGVKLYGLHAEEEEDPMDLAPLEGLAERLGGTVAGQKLYTPSRESET